MQTMFNVLSMALSAVILGGAAYVLGELALGGLLP